MVCIILFADHPRRYLAGKISVSSKSKFARSLHRRHLRGSSLNGCEVPGSAGCSPSLARAPRTTSLLSRLMMWLPPNVSLQALIAAIRRLLVGGGWQHVNSCAVLLLKLRPLLFCALYAAGHRWAAWCVCIACDIAAVKLVRFDQTGIMNIGRFVSDSPCSAAHAHGMEDASAKAAVQEAGSKWQWYLLRNPFYNATVSRSRPRSPCCALTHARRAPGWEDGLCGGRGYGRCCSHRSAGRHGHGATRARGQVLFPYQLFVTCRFGLASC